MELVLREGFRVPQAAPLALLQPLKHWAHPPSCPSSPIPSCSFPLELIPQDTVSPAGGGEQGKAPQRTQSPLQAWTTVTQQLWCFSLERGRSGDDLWESSLWVKARGLGFVSALLRALHMTSARLFHCSSGCSENEQMALFHHPLSPLGHSPRVLLWQLPLTVLGVHEESPNTP